MDKWKNLPYEILKLVFYYIGQRIEVSPPKCPEFHLISPTKDILQCQLTCKSWNKPAQSVFYKFILFDSLEKSQAFFNMLINYNSNIGSLVKYIRFRNFYEDLTEIDTSSTEIMFPYIPRIACLLPELKRFYCDTGMSTDIYKRIELERLQKGFLKLEVLPKIIPYDKNYVSQYNTTVNLFKQSLRELMIYDLDSVLFQDKEKLTSFYNIDSLTFKFSIASNIYLVDEYISKCPTVKKVYIYYKKIGSTKILESSSYKHICSNVEVIKVEYPFFGNVLYNYLMNVFPNVKSFDLRFSLDYELSRTLSTETALIFLHYLIKIPNVFVEFIPLENLKDTMFGLYDSINAIKNLSIKYRQDISVTNVLPEFCVLSKTKKDIDIDVTYHQLEALVLPHIGLIETSGYNLESLTVDMGFYFENIFRISRYPDYPDILSYLMRRCYNLQSISLEYTFLYFNNSIRAEVKPNPRKYVRLYQSLVHPSFFLGLSTHAPYIENFILCKCILTIDETNGKNISIDMPNTEFDTTTFEDIHRVHYIYIRLATTVNNNSSVCYRVTKDNYEICEEEDYTKSLEDEESISIYFRCRSIRTIKIEYPNFIIEDIKT